MDYGKTPWSDRMSTELFRQCKSCLLPLWHDIIFKYQGEGKVPQDLRDAKIITLYKNKGSMSDWTNRKGIFLHDFAGLAFTRVILFRLRTLA